MLSMGEIYSGETEAHVKRVSCYSRLFALHYGLNEKDAELVRDASSMHDIGKSGIPYDILSKPTKLTDEEYDIMKTHTEIGYHMLSSSKDKTFLAAAEIANTHHEKWDGTGYPNGLKGEDIPVFGRITAIADVFDALCSERCYKGAWSDSDIFDFIRKEKGFHFEPLLVDIFFANIEGFFLIRERYNNA